MVVVGKRTNRNVRIGRKKSLEICGKLLLECFVCHKYLLGCAGSWEVKSPHSYLCGLYFIMSDKKMQP